MKTYIIVLIALLISLSTFAQGLGLNYKAVIKDDNGYVMTNQNLKLKFTILDLIDTSIYEETHTTTTDANGIIIVTIGLGTEDIMGSFFGIDWVSNLYKLKTDVDTEPYDIFVPLGTTPFEAVPYALNAASKLDDLADGKADTNGSSLFIGVDAGLNDDGTANQNVGVGYKTLTSNTTGVRNSAIGYSALYSNIEGDFNTAIGYFSLQFNTAGDNNTAIGYSALNKNITGINNTAIGSLALFSNITGKQNTANGSGALYKNTTGDYNTATGDSALLSNIGGDYNTANGIAALNGNTEGNYNTAIGNAALSSNTTGNSNMANGSSSLSSNTEGDFNTANGNQALTDNETGNNNTANGSNALGSNETGDGNIALGKSAGSLNVSGSDNIFIGNGTGSSTGQSNRLYIDNSSTSTPLIYGEFDTDLLRINGTLDINDAYQFPITDGTASQTLQTDGAGSLSWQTSEVPTGLEEITAFGKTGWRLVGSNSNNHGNIGISAIDFSYSTFGPSINGATGNFSIAMGVNTSAKSYAETVVGSFNTDYTITSNFNWGPGDRLFVIGNGTSTDNRSNALTVLKNGNAIFDAEIQRPDTGSADMIPIAYGTVESNANELSGTGNFSATISSDVITITVDNENLTVFNSAGTIVPYGGNPRFSTLTYVNNKLEVRVFNSSGILTPTTFQFVLYKL